MCLPELLCARQSSLVCDRRANLAFRFFLRNGTAILAEFKIVEKRPPPKAPEVFVTEEELRANLSQITTTVNSVLHAAYSLLVCECNPMVLRTMVGLYAVAFLSYRLGSTGTCFLLFLGALTVPKAYELKHDEIDSMFVMVKLTGMDLWNKQKATAKKRD